MWPVNFGSLRDRVFELADQARKEWPETPRKGEVVDGVKIGARTSQIETCVECGKVIGGGAADPLARIDGKPLHRTPCYQTRWQRNKRKKGA